MAKIGDFGLARDVYKYHEYHKKSSVSSCMCTLLNSPTLDTLFLSFTQFLVFPISTRVDITVYQYG